MSEGGATAKRKFDEQFTTGTGQKLLVHRAGDCAGEFCSIHKPSNHHMREFLLHWRDDKRTFERICPHGVGHPDPDALNYIKERYGAHEAEAMGIHGCCGCCAKPVDDPYRS